MTNVWDEIGNIDLDLSSPKYVIEEMFSPIAQRTNGKVNFKVQWVNYFPEEVTYKVTNPDYSQLSVINNVAPLKLFDGIVNPHPEFGYDPDDATTKQYFRCRLLLLPQRHTDVEVELFKFKFPLDFYPVRFYIEKSDFPELSNMVTSLGLAATNEAELKDIVNAIIKSDSTLKLIRRIMAL